MENYSPLKLPKLTDPDLKAVQNAAQLACYHCTDPTASRHEVKKSINDAFKLSLEAIERKCKQAAALQQKIKFLQGELQIQKEKLVEAEAKIEVLAGASAFYTDERKDAAVQTEEPDSEVQDMSWTDQD